MPDSDSERREALAHFLRDWWDPPDELVDTLPRAGLQLKYLSHIWVSRAFTETDPEWWWEPMGYDGQGLPVIERDGQGRPVGLWIWLHLCGTRMPGYGSVEPGQGDAVKCLIGDALRNAGMRRGCAGKLWAKDKPAESGKRPPKARSSKPAADAGQDWDEARARLFHDEMLEAYGEKVVKGAYATFGIAKLSELTPVNCEAIRASLKQRQRLARQGVVDAGD